MSLPLSIPSPDPEWRILVNLGDVIRGLGLDWFRFDVNIYMYAICIGLGIIASVLVTNWRLVRRGVEPWIVLDFAIWAVIFGIIGARAYHVLTHPADYFGENFSLVSIFAIWEGGLAIFGALIGGAVGVVIAARTTGLRFWSVADAIAPTLLLAQAFGRVGNWFNQELFGRPTDLPWGLEIDSGNPAIPSGLPDGVLFHPTFLYEALWNLLGFALILVVSRRFGLQWGKVLSLYLIWYGAGRVWLESLRIDPSEVFLGLRTNVWTAIAAIALGVVIFVVQSRRHPGREPSPYLPGREWKPEPAIQLDDVYSDSDETDEAGPAVDETPATSGRPTIHQQ